jgi:phosphate transport system substrate-binding protein
MMPTPLLIMRPSSILPCLARLGLRALPFFAAATALAQTAGGDPALPAYESHPVEVPKDASYLLPDGSVYIVGNDGMDEVMARFNELFTKNHPGIKFTVLLKGSSTGIGGLTAGVSVLAPMGREAWPTDLSGFREAFGYNPTDVRIGYDGYTRAKHKNPPAIYVNSKNPIAGLTLDEVKRIFTSGSAKGDLTHWNQVGLKGAWAKRVIHLYGPRDEGGFATSLRVTLMDKLPFASNYEGLPKLADVINAVAEDPYGIGLVGFFDAASATPDVKLVPLGTKKEGPFVSPDYDMVHAGRYPLSPALHFYVNRAPGKPLDPLVKEYLRLALSREGQAIVESQKNNDEGYVPLTAEAAAAELAKLDGAVGP